MTENDIDQQAAALAKVPPSAVASALRETAPAS